MKSNKIHELKGVIQNKELVKVYQKERKGQFYYKLFPKIENAEDVKQLFVYQDKVSVEIWTDIEKSNFVDKRYLFTCQKYRLIPNNYRLLDWKELEDKVSENHEKK